MENETKYIEKLNKNSILPKAVNRFRILKQFNNQISTFFGSDVPLLSNSFKLKNPKKRHKPEASMVDEVANEGIEMPYAEKDIENPILSYLKIFVKEYILSDQSLVTLGSKAMRSTLNAYNSKYNKYQHILSTKDLNYGHLVKLFKNLFDS
jgi:hypothetical protein